MGSDADVLVAGAGPAGSATAILLAKAGWRVVLMEQHSYPRHKVCGECVGAGALAVLDALGVGLQFRQRAGPELRRLGWMSADSSVTADMPTGLAQHYRYGHAIGRHRLDPMLLERARVVGVQVIQPARLRHIDGLPGQFQCVYQVSADRGRDHSGPGSLQTLNVPLVVNALGSSGRHFEDIANDTPALRLQSDLLAFKARFRNSKLARGLLPLIALRGGYGGMVVADDGRTTVACCVRRDLLKRCRELAPGQSAGTAIEVYLRTVSRGVGDALEDAEREGSWLSAGPIEPGIRLTGRDGVFRVGNSAGETHPLVGEGICMALQSATLLADHLTRTASQLTEPRQIRESQRRYAVAWRCRFTARIRLSAIYARIAMSTALAAPVGMLLRRSPPLLTQAARLAGKARAPLSTRSPPRHLE